MRTNTLLFTILNLIPFILLTIPVYAHDLEYTLIQNGYKKIASCKREKGDVQDPTVTILKTTKRSFLLFNSKDEDQAFVREFILETNFYPNGHDSEVYFATGMKFELNTVGENNLPATLTFLNSETAIKIWLNTYSDSALNMKFQCELL